MDVSRDEGGDGLSLDVSFVFARLCCTVVCFWRKEVIAWCRLGATGSGSGRTSRTTRGLVLTATSFAPPGSARLLAEAQS